VVEHTLAGRSTTPAFFLVLESSLVTCGSVLTNEEMESHNFN